MGFFTRIMKRTPLLIISLDYIEDPYFLTLIKVKDMDGRTATLKVSECVPRFWTEKDPSSMREIPPQIIDYFLSDKTTIHDKKLYELEVRKPSDLKNVRDFFYPHYSSDVPWSSLARWTYGWKSVVDINSSLWEKILDKKDFIIKPHQIKTSSAFPDQFKLNTLWFDIETEDSLDVENAPERVVSIAIMDTVTGIHEIGTCVPTSERQVARFLSSQEALESVVEHTKPIPPLDFDKVKVISFDHVDLDSREAALMHWFKQRVEELDRDLLGGQYIKGYDVPYLKNRCIRMRRIMLAKHNGNVPVHLQFPLLTSTFRRPLFDSKIAYAEQVQGAAATTGSGSLAWMSGTVLGYGKVPRSRITDLMKNPMMLAVYNAWDNVCVERCMEKLQLVPFYLTKVSFNNSTIKNAHSNMMLVEDMMGHILMEQDKVMPSMDIVRNSLSGTIEQGGEVMEAPSGVFENAFEIDEAMEYPSVVIMGNLSPETLVNPDDYPNGFPFKISKTPAGRIYRLDKEGIMPSVLRNLAVSRKETQHKMREAYENGNSILGDILNRKQTVMKQNMNSWYGVLGSGATEKTKRRPFRLANPLIGSDITEVARLHNRWNKERVEKYSLWFSNDGIYPMIIDNSIELKFKVIGQDTDSCKVAILNHDEAEKQIRKFTETDIMLIAEIICKKLNESYHEFAKFALNRDENEFFLIKPDAYYRRFFSWGAKKRYAYVDYKGNFGFRGVEIRRSSVPKIVKDAQYRVFDSILNGCKKSELNELLREIHSDILDENKTDSMDFGQPMGVKTKGTMAWKAAMWSNEHLDTDFDVGDKPVLFFASSTETSLPSNQVVAIEWGETPESYGVEVNREMAFQRHFADSRSWEKILGAFATSWKSALSRMNQTTLEDW